MSDPKDLEFPWLRFLFSALFWCYVAMVVLGFLRILFEPIFVDGAGAPLDFGQIFSLAFWVRVFGTSLISVIEASIILIPSFYAGMMACMRLEKHHGSYEKQFETSFRVSATITFGILTMLLILVLFAMKLEPLNIAFDIIQLIIIYYIFDDNVAEAVWPRIFEKRQNAQLQTE